MAGAAAMTVAFVAVVVFSPDSLIDEDWEIVDAVSYTHLTLPTILLV